MYRVARRALTAGDPGNSWSKVCEIQLELSGFVARLCVFNSRTIGQPFVQLVSVFLAAVGFVTWIASSISVTLIWATFFATTEPAIAARIAIEINGRHRGLRVTAMVKGHIQPMLRNWG